MLFHCEICNFSSHRQRELSRHQRVHRHRCTHCSEVLTTMSKLKEHILCAHSIDQSTQTIPEKPQRTVTRAKPAEVTPAPARSRRRHSGKLKVRFSTKPKRQRPYWQREWCPSRYDVPTPPRSVESKIVRTWPEDPPVDPKDPLGLARAAPLKDIQFV